MPQTWGVPVEEIVRGIRHWRAQGQYRYRLPARDDRAVPPVAAQTRSEFDPRKFLKPAMDALRALCRDRFEQFGTAGKPAGSSSSRCGMARRYRRGALDPRIDAMSRPRLNVSEQTEAGGVP